MENTFQKTDTSLTITRVFKASPEEMWELWTDPAKISLWHVSSATGTSVVEADAKVGGKFKIIMSDVSSQHVVTGTFKEVSPPTKLVYSWQWEGDPSTVSEVSITLTLVDGGTKLTLVHEKLSGPESVEAHGKGWLGCMENINQLIERN